MKTNDTIKVHLYDLHNKEIQTRNYGKTFCVYEKAGADDGRLERGNI